MEKIRVIINTDIGDDVDDTLAIAYALEHSELDIVGITTVYKDVDKRAQLVYEVLKEYGRCDIPIYTGSPNPILNRPYITEPPKIYEAYRLDEKVAVYSDAVGFIIGTIKEHPETIILEMGPQTNLALAYLQAPTIMEKANVIAMGGYFKGVYPEWNIVCDPEAAKIVTDFSKRLTMIGLEITIQTALTDKHYAQIDQGNNSHRDFLLRYIKEWKKVSGFGVTLHDALLIEYLIHPELFETREGQLIVNVSEGEGRGITYPRFNAFRPEEIFSEGHTYVTKIDVETFVKRFLDKMF